MKRFSLLLVMFLTFGLLAPGAIVGAEQWSANATLLICSSGNP